MNYDLIQTITGILGLTAIFLLFWRIGNESKWNKLQFSIDKVKEAVLDEALYELSNSGIDFSNEKMSDAEYRKLTNKEKDDCFDDDALFKVHNVLGMFEDFATLYNMNVLNNKFAYESYSENTLFFYSKFKRIIDFCREEEKDPFYYEHLEKCAGSFLKIKQKKLKKVDRKTKAFKKLEEKNKTRLEELQTSIKFSSKLFDVEIIKTKKKVPNTV